MRPKQPKGRILAPDEQAIITMALNAEIIRMENMLPGFKSELKKVLQERIDTARALVKEFRKPEVWLASSDKTLPFF